MAQQTQNEFEIQQTEDIQQLNVNAFAEPPPSQEETTVGKTEIADDEAANAALDERPSWGNKLDFFFAMLGSCVGLGNVWRFPYLAFKNGGGAFLIPYILMCIFIGLPLFILESGIGQFSSSSAIKAWRLSPIFMGLGIGSTILAIFISLFYHVLIAQFLYYLFLSMNDPLPWAGCCTWWGASSCCRQCLPGDPDCVIVDCERPVLATNCTRYNLPSEEFYDTYVIQLSSGFEEFGTPVWQLALCLFATWVIVALVLLFGAKSFGKVAYFTALFPYVMLTVMLIRGATLPGAGDGVLFYLIPKWERLLDLEVWSDAAGQSFFSISAAVGILTSLGSYNKFNHPVVRDGLLIVLFDVLTSIFSGFVVFTVLGYMAIEKNTTIADVVTVGPALVFETYPAALATMPVAPLWSILFFMMMITLGLGSALSSAETVLITAQDMMVGILKNNKWRAAAFRIGTCMTFFLVSLPMTCNGGMYFFTILEHATAEFGLLSIGFSECMVISWVYGWRRFQKDLKFMTGWTANWFFIICWTVLSPVVILFLLIMVFVPSFSGLSFEGYVFPDWAVGLDIFFMIMPILAVPVWWLYYNCYHLQYWTIIRYSARPDESWGPADSANWKIYREDPTNIYESKTSIADRYYKAMLKAKPLEELKRHAAPRAFELKSVDVIADTEAGPAYDEKSRAVHENQAFEETEIVEAGAYAEPEPEVVPEPEAVAPESARSPRSNKVYPQ